jgi:hypothetical protein
MIPPETSAWLTAAIITLIGAPFLMAQIPRCNHAECRKAHEEATTQERRATNAAELARLHAWHDRFRPQPNCALCRALPPDKPDE